MRKIRQVNFIFMICALLPLITAVIFSILKIDFSDSLTNIIVSQIIYVLPAVIYLIICGMNPIEALRIKKVRISNVFLIILFTYLVMPLISLVNVISQIFGENEIASTAIDITDNYPLIVGILVLGLVPAVFEESVYRGVLYNEYRKANPRIAIVLSALLFGLLHGNLNQFAYAFVMGMIFCFVIEATDSIIATMIMHFIVNSTSTVSTYLLPRVYQFLEQAYGSDVYNAEELYAEAIGSVDRVTLIQMAYTMIIPVVIATALAFVVYRTIAKNAGRYEHVKQIFTNNENHASVKSFISIPLLIGMITCIYYIVCNLIF